MVGVAVVGTVGGCSSGGSSPSADSRGKPPAPGTLQKAQAARDSLTLLARYDATLAVHPQLAGRLSPLRAHVALHASAFGGKPPAPAAGSPSSTAPGGTSSAPARPSTAPPSPRTGAGTPSPAPSAPSVPATPAAALAALAAEERTLADRRAAALLTVPGDLARLMASVAAAGAAHVVLLTPGVKTV